MDEHAGLCCGISALIVVAAAVLLHRPDAQLAQGPVSAAPPTVRKATVADVKPGHKWPSPVYTPGTAAVYVSIREPSADQPASASPEGRRPASRASSRDSSAWRASGSKLSRP